MSASPAHYRNRAITCVTGLAPFLRHVNTRTLAFFMFVALALLSTTRGKEAETRELAPAGTTKSEVVIEKQHDDVVTEAAGQTMSPPLTLWQFMGRIGSRPNAKDFGNKIHPSQ